MDSIFYAKILFSYVQIKTKNTVVHERILIFENMTPQQKQLFQIQVWKKFTPKIQLGSYKNVDGSFKLYAVFLYK